MTTVLVADDDKGTRMTLGRILSGLGLNVVFASDGMRARMVLEDNPDIHLLITDVVMPVLDGRELVAGLRREERFDELGIIMMSATVTVCEITRLLELGASRFLAKPVNERALCEEIEAILTAPEFGPKGLARRPGWPGAVET
jgi:CheY-like chemotaxis protein